MRSPSSEVRPAEAAAGIGALFAGRRRVAIFLYGSVAFLYWASLYTYVPTLPTYAATLTPDLVLIGTILSMYGLWQALARLPVGIASDWLGRRKPFIAGGLALSAFGALVMAGARTPQALLVGRSITGLSAATWVPLTVIFSSLYPAEQAVQATTTLTLMSAVARVFATAATGPLNAAGGYSLAFFVAAVLAAMGIVLVLIAGEIRRPAQAPTARGIARLASRRDVLLPALLSVVANYVLQGLGFGFVALMAKDLGAADSVISNLTVIHLAVYTPSVLATAFLLKRFDKRPLLLAGFLALALGAACGAVANSIAWLLAVQVLLAIGYGLCYPILMGMSIEWVDGAERATAMGVHQSVYALGMFAGPWLSGIIAARIGMQPMFAVTAVATLMLGVPGIFWATQGRGRREGSDASGLRTRPR
ncbi:MAG: MFS transporter [Nitrososphaerales archaeon]